MIYILYHGRNFKDKESTNTLLNFGHGMMD